MSRVLAKSIHILDPQNIILSDSEKLLYVDLQLPKHQLNVTHHLLQTHNTQHLRSILFSLVPQGMSQKRDAQGFEELCPSFLNYTPTAKTRMKGLLLPNLDVHLSLQAPSKGCNKNPGKKESPMNRPVSQRS